MITVGARSADRGRIEVITGPMFAGKSEELMRRVRRATIAGLEVLVVNHALDTRHGASAVASHAGGRIPAQAVSDAEELRRLVVDYPAQSDYPGRSGHLGPLGSPSASAKPLRTLDLVAVDEAQFFGEALVPVVVDLADRGTTVVVSGLCQTFDDRPFEPLPTLMASAEQVTKLLAVCSVCGADASFHRRVAAAGAGARTARSADHRGPAGAVTAGEGDVPGEVASAVGSSLRPTAEHVGGSGTYQARCRRHR